MASHYNRRLGDDKKQVTFYTRKSKYTKFQELFPGLATTIFNRLVDIALINPDFIRDIIFYDFGDN